MSYLPFLRSKTGLGRGIAIVLAASLTTSCSNFFQPLSSGKATLDYHSGITDLLRTLPPPPEPIVVAVYKFRDQTGQYKSSENLVQYSTAVTQGGANMLIRALMEAGNGRWFKVLEREGLTDLTNERKIITQTRQMYDSPPEGNKSSLPPLPPLLYAPILLEGGITAYETNLITGGVGAHYFGAGGATEFRRDTVTSMLRAVSVKNGEVLNHVDSRKTIFSVQLDSGLFRYVAFKRLLEIEAGVTSNEPPQMAVMETIESCVYGMIMEGLIKHLWSLKDPALLRPLIEEYVKQRDTEMVAEFDSNGQLTEVKPKNDALPAPSAN
ncbi:CsgG/HfaB family protein [Methylomicrobium lacus]|uniref:CsgG/HfaB family protein n=1 Tax=Methylomicrobium lacus TaxID=136992 RepID=UPI0035A8F4C0